MLMFVNYKYFIYRHFIKNYKEIKSMIFSNYIFVELYFSASPALDTLFWCIKCNTLK